uniref:ANF_receptor domain-containing protein n=1 Tax=Bursaphelenchus xylophilus TaxID=6326 RepID=A0A1I7S9B1_BURXY
MFKELLLTFLLLQSRFFSFLVAEIDDDDLELIETPDDEYEDNLASNNSSANSTINKLLRNSALRNQKTQTAFVIAHTIAEDYVIIAATMDVAKSMFNHKSCMLPDWK